MKKRLNLTDQFAIKLLTSLGLEPDGDLWKVSRSNQAMKNHKRWMRLEKTYEKRFE